MKKTLFLVLLITSVSYGQGLMPTKLKITSNAVSPTAPFVNVQETDGFVNKINKSDLVDVIEVASAVNLPVTGVAGKIYVTLDNNRLYRWTGIIYQELTSDVTGKEDKSNKSSSFTASSTNTYPNTKALVDGLASKQDIATVTDFNKSYIAPYTTSNIRNSEGDILVLKDGRYLSAYTQFGVVATDFSPSKIIAKISTDNTGKNWGSEIVISENIGAINVISVSLLRIDSSTIRCFFLVRNSFTDLELYQTTSTNEGLTWGSSTKITNNGYTDILNASVKRANSNRILIAGESTPDGSVGSPTWGIFTYYSDNNGVSYTKSNIVNFATSDGETSVCWLGANEVLLTSRSTDGFQWFSKSTNNGTTWGTPYKSTLASTNSPAQIVNYSGTLLAIHNPNTTGGIRNPLTISKSTDTGNTWVKVTDLNLNEADYFRYAYPSITLDGDSMLVSYYEITGDAGQGLKFAIINIPDLLAGVKPKSPSPDNMFLKGLTFDKAEPIQPGNNVTTALGRLQAQFNSLFGKAYKYIGFGAGLILQNDQPDNVMDGQFISYRNTDGSVVTNVGHISSSQDYEVFTNKEISFSTPLFKVNNDSDFFGKVHITTPALQMHLEGSSQASFDMEKTGGYKIRIFIDSNNFGFYNFNNGLVPFEISNTTAIVNFSQIPTVPTAPVGANTNQVANAAFVMANSRPYKVWSGLVTQSGTSAPVATVLENTLGGTVTFNRVSSGYYTATSSALFTSGKTIVFVSVGIPKTSLANQTTSQRVLNTSTVEIYPRENNSFGDDLLTNTSIEIRVYNFMLLFFPYSMLRRRKRKINQLN